MEGGVYLLKGTLQHITVSANTSLDRLGSGLYQAGGTAENSVFFGNGGHPTLDVDGNVYRTAGAFTYNCALPAQTGTGNVATDPLFINAEARDYKLMPGSPCRDTALTLAAVTNDLNRVARPQDGDSNGTALPDMGCYEAGPANEGALRCGFSVSPEVGFLTLTSTFTATVHGAETEGLEYDWDFDGDGTIDATGTSLQTATHAYLQPGFYTVILTVRNNLEESAQATRQNCVRITPETAYVSHEGLSIAPYDTWEKATSNLQDVVDILLPIEGVHYEVVVTNGSYNILSFWVEVTAPMTIRSLNGPAVTTLKAANPGEPNWRRIISVDHPDAFIAGFTMTGGNVLNKTEDNGGPGALRLISGTVSNCVISSNVGASNSGGVEQRGGLLTDCVITKNRAYHGNNQNGRGGGAWISGGTMRRCVITDNLARWAGGGIRVTDDGKVEACQIINNTSGDSSNSDRHGGGLYQTGGSVTACIIKDNKANGMGGGAYLTGGALQSSLIVSNKAATVAGNGHGIYLNGASARLENATVVDNSLAVNGSGLYLVSGSVTNSIVYFNGTNDLNQTGGSIGYSCWNGAPETDRNISNDPKFLDRTAGNYRLSSASPCVNSGSNSPWTPTDLDLDGNPRILFTICDMGAYENLLGNVTLIIVR